LARPRSGRGWGRGIIGMTGDRLYMHDPDREWQVIGLTGVTQMKSRTGEGGARPRSWRVCQRSGGPRWGGLLRGLIGMTQIVRMAGDVGCIGVTQITSRTGERGGLNLATRRGLD
jgi:hypothetical protein